MAREQAPVWPRAITPLWLLLWRDDETAFAQEPRRQALPTPPQEKQHTVFFWGGGVVFLWGGGSIGDLVNGVPYLLAILNACTVPEFVWRPCVREGNIFTSM